MHLAVFDQKQYPLLEQPPYSRNLAPCALFLFPKLQEVIKEAHFGDVEAIKRAVTVKLKEIPEESFQESINEWKKRMEKCIRFEGDYFEGENV